MFGKQNGGAETAEGAPGEKPGVQQEPDRGKVTMGTCRITLSVAVVGRWLHVAGAGGPGMPANGFAVPLPLLGKVMAVNGEGPSLLMENGDLLLWRPVSLADLAHGKWEKQYNVMEVATRGM